MVGASCAFFLAGFVPLLACRRFGFTVFKCFYIYIGN